MRFAVIDDGLCVRARGRGVEVLEENPTEWSIHELKQSDGEYHIIPYGGGGFLAVERTSGNVTSWARDCSGEWVIVFESSFSGPVIDVVVLGEHKLLFVHERGFTTTRDMPSTTATDFVYSQFYVEFERFPFDDHRKIRCATGFPSESSWFAYCRGDRYVDVVKGRTPGDVVTDDTLDDTCDCSYMHPLAIVGLKGPCLAVLTLWNIVYLFAPPGSGGTKWKITHEIQLRSLMETEDSDDDEEPISWTITPSRGGHKFILTNNVIRTAFEYDTDAKLTTTEYEQQLDFVASFPSTPPTAFLHGGVPQHL